MPGSLQLDVVGEIVRDGLPVLRSVSNSQQRSMTKKRQASTSVVSRSDSDTVSYKDCHASKKIPDFEEINQFFESALNTIPAQVYFASASVQVQPAIKPNRYIHKRSGTAPSEHKCRKSGKEKCEEKSIVEIQKDAFLKSEDCSKAKLDVVPTADLRERLHEKIRDLNAKRKRDPSKPEKRQRTKKQKLSSMAKAETTPFKKATQHTHPALESAVDTVPSREQTKANKTRDITIANIDLGEKKREKKMAPGSKKSRLEKALKRSEHEKAELETMPPGEKIVKQTEISTKLALLKAQGVKIRNDPTLIKKSLKSFESKKKHSAKKWDKRQQASNKAKAQRENAIRDSIK